VSTPPELIQVTDTTSYKKKCGGIPVLKNYAAKPDPKFWKQFPLFYPNNRVQTKIDVTEFEKLIQECWPKWNAKQKRNALRALKTQKEGAFTKLKTSLPNVECKNAKSAENFGELMTDTIGHWIQNKMVAGPYKAPPFGVFRVNPLMAVPQKNKVRPIMNLSAPSGESLNDAIRPESVKRLKMSSAKNFGYEIKRAGRFAEFAKFDMQDAYKLIPGHPGQWWLYGFQWLGRYFYDVTTVFGSGAAPANFDSLPEAVADIACTLSGAPKKWLHRQLDDAPYVSAAGSGYTKKFADAYRMICDRVRIPLAAECPDREKAFGPGCTGTVLGINFDSCNMTWNISKAKSSGILGAIDWFLLSKTCTLREVQELHGKLNDFGQMMPFSRGFRFNLLELLGSFDPDSSEKRLIKKPLKKDLQVWRNMVLTAESGLPLPDIPRGPPARTLNFVSDAAGAAFEWQGAEWKNVTKIGDRGAASIGYQENGIFYCGTAKWPHGLMTNRRDCQGKFFGSKSTFLETIGLLIPFVTIPSKLAGQYITLYLDNLNVVYGWNRKHCKTDTESSILLRALHVIEARLECRIFVEHMGRLSTEESALADHLTRQSSTTAEDEEKLRRADRHEAGGVLAAWLLDPVPNWDIVTAVVSEIENKI